MIYFAASRIRRFSTETEGENALLREPTKISLNAPQNDLPDTRGLRVKKELFPCLLSGACQRCYEKMSHCNISLPDRSCSHRAARGRC